MTRENRPAPRGTPTPSPDPDAERKDRVTRQVRADDPPEPGSPASDGAEPDLRTQHERDQSSDSAGDEPRDVMHQAKRDLDAGLVDTDLRSTPGADAERRRELLERAKKQATEPKPKPGR